MVNEKLRKELDELVEMMGLSEEEAPLLLDNSSYDNSIIGMTEDNRLVYDYESMIEEFAEENKCSLEEAQEWVDYNTMRAIPYFGNRAPIVITHRFNKQ